MEIQSKQKLKKRKTRRNLNEIRRRSRTEVKNNENPSKLHIISKCSNIEQITSERLTLALFNKTIRSETITRIPLPRADHRISNKFNNAHHDIEKTPTFCKQYQNSSNANNKIIILRKNDNKTTIFKPQIETSRSINVDAINTPNSATLFSSINNLSGDSVSEISSEEYTYKKELLTHTSYTSSDMESENCVYEKFMNCFPEYLTEHFPALSKGVTNKSITYLRKSYLEHCHKEFHEPWKHVNNNFTIQSPPGYIDSDSIIHKPMEYIEKESLCQQSMKKQENVFISSNSSSLLRFGSNSNNSTCADDSPEYLYFPHKLNQ